MDIFFKMPNKVKMVHMYAILKIPIGATQYEEIITEYPEYFPEETEHRRKWSLIPQEVHDAYKEEFSAFKQVLWKDAPPSPGFMGMVNNTEDYNKWEEIYKQLSPVEKEKEKELDIKYYTPYGIKFSR